MIKRISIVLGIAAMLTIVPYYAGKVILDMLHWWPWSGVFTSNDYGIVLYWSSGAMYLGGIAIGTKMCFEFLRAIYKYIRYGE